MTTDAFERLKEALADRYSVEREIGAGGMATVYLAEDLKHNRKVAIKVLRPDLGAVLGGERFLQEIQLTANLQHPHIVALYDSGEAAGLLYYVMPYVEGESLRDLLNREKRLPVREAVRIAADIAAALEYAHRRNVVHRDMKPENILLHEGAVMVADFGIARATAAAGAQRLTQTGLAVGTPAYMSPEQAAGSTDLDARSDLYSLGCVFYEMLAGGPPFTATTPRAIIAKHMVDEPPSLASVDAEVPEGVAAAVDRVLAKEPEDRHQTAAEFGEALEGAMLTGAVPAQSSGAWLVEELVHTKTIHVVGAYIAVSVIGVALAKWASGQFVLSPHLATFVAVALTSLLPAVGILAHYRGGRRRTRWTLSRTIGISANVIAAIAVLFLVFGGKDLGAATVTVAVQDEDGTVAERVVPKAAYRRKVGMFQLDNASGDSELDWLQLGLPFAVGIDLLQDPFLSVSDPVDLADELTEAGEPDGLGLPLTIKRRVALESHLGHFVGGEISRVGDSIRVVVDLYDTDRGRLLQRRTYDGSDVFEFVDSISVQLRRDLGIPAGALDLTTDLPSSELFTESREAYRAFAEGLKSFTQADFESATARLERAVAIDSTFAFAHLLRYQTLTQLNRAEEGNQAIAAAMEHSYRLTERIRFVARVIYYWLVQQDADRGLAVATMWTELYPEDIGGHAQRAQMLVLRGENDAAIGSMLRILELDPTRHNYLQEIAGLYETRGQYDSALAYFDAYATRLPDDPRSYVARAGVRWRLGQYDAAASDYERALALDPGNVAAYLGLGSVSEERGDFSAAAGFLEEGLAASRTPLRRAEVLVALRGLYERQGQLARAIDYMHETWAVRAPVTGPFQEAQSRSQEVGLYAAAGQANRALDSLRALEAQLGEQFGSIASFGYLAVGRELDSAELVEQGVAAVERFIEAFGFESVRFVVFLGRGVAHELRGNCGEAVPLYERALESAPPGSGLAVQIARCKRKLGDRRAAKERLTEVLEIRPFYEPARYEMAMVLADEGRDDEALEHIAVALEVWRDADPEFKWARRARELRERLTGNRAP